MPAHITAYQPVTVVVAADGTGDYTTIQAGIDALPSAGGIVYIKNGTYTITVAITIPSNVSIVGNGDNTIITMSNNIAYCFSNKTRSGAGNSNIMIKDVMIDGNQAGMSAAGNGIDMAYVTNLRIVGCNVYDCYGNGIVIDTSSSFVNISGCYIHGNRIRGIYISSPSTIIRGNVIDLNTDVGIYINGTDTLIVNNVCSRNTKEGIYLDGCDYANVTGNIVKNNSYGSVGTYSGIHLINSTDYCNVSNNVCIDNQGTATQNYGILEAASTEEYNKFIGNVFYGNVTADYSLNGTNHVVDTGKKGEKFLCTIPIYVSGGAEGVGSNTYVDFADRTLVAIQCSDLALAGTTVTAKLLLFSKVTASSGSIQLYNKTDSAAVGGAEITGITQTSYTEKESAGFSLPTSGLKKFELQGKLTDELETVYVQNAYLMIMRTIG